MDLDKKFFRRFARFLKPIHIGIFLAIAIVSGVVCIMALRDNNQKALDLRDKVIQVDKDNGDIETALRELRSFVYAHMNTDLAAGDNAIKPPIQLKYRYERLLEAQQQDVKRQSDQIYSEAQAECERKFPSGLRNSGRIPCITEYIATKGIKQEPIPDSLYKFDFVSPLWSPDLAGWSLVVASVTMALFVIRLGMGRWVKTELHDL